MMLTYQEFAKSIGATHGSVKRWAHEGMPVNRDGVTPMVEPDAANAWLSTKQRRPSMRNRMAFVYFAQRADGCIKIGFTSDVDRRMVELRKEFGYEKRPTLLATLPGDKRLELTIQKTFASAHQGKEWFKPTRELLAFIEPLKRGVAA